MTTSRSEADNKLEERGVVQLPAKMPEGVEALLSHYVLGGSQALGLEKANDTDYFCLASDEPLTVGSRVDYALSNLGWVATSRGSIPESDDWKVYRSKSCTGLDLIITTSQKSYERAAVAIELSKRLTLTRRDQRVSLYKAVLYRDFGEDLKDFEQPVDLDLVFSVATPTIDIASKVCRKIEISCPVHIRDVAYAIRHGVLLDFDPLGFDFSGTTRGRHDPQ